MEQKKRVRELARLIYSMTYSELTSVAHQFSEMRDPDVRPKIETPQEYVDLLHDWAEATVSDEDKPA